MFGHPTRNAFALVAPNCRSLNNDAYRCMVTRNGPFTKILKHMRQQWKSATGRLINAQSIPGQCACCDVGCRVSPCKVGLSDFEDMKKRRVEEGNLSPISVTERLIPNIGVMSRSLSRGLLRVSGCGLGPGKVLPLLHQARDPYDCR